MHGFAAVAAFSSDPAVGTGQYSSVPHLSAAFRQQYHYWGQGLHAWQHGDALLFAVTAGK